MVAAVEKMLNARASIRSAFPKAKNELSRLIQQEVKISDPSGVNTLRVIVDSYKDELTLYWVTISGPNAEVMAQRYLPVLATVWFEGNVLQEAADWVRSGIKKVSPGKPIVRRVGDVEMALAGDRNSIYSLTIQHKDYQSWLSPRIKEMKEQILKER